ncbi:Hypothetical predicted protein [Olea europaea subsp. europaea]|uniref:Uncharacterized protein n=1 Tax=Olea europaea subsp. europaea TaxID=158383 RepID=A0A8S0V2T9_OLEEU|nr:Hypothetical predicted protein [Olea europaea subsp. europaea]
MAKAKQGDTLLDLSYILGELKGMATDMGSELDRACQLRIQAMLFLPHCVHLTILHSDFVIPTASCKRSSASLSRHEVAEDIQIFGGLMRATGHSSNSGLIRRNGMRNLGEDDVNSLTLRLHLLKVRFALR